MTDTTSTPTTFKVNINDLAKGTITALILQVSGALLTYLAQVFLAREMGKSEYGIYAYAIAFSTLLAIPASLGLPRTVLRLIPQYRVQEDWERLRGILLSSWQLTIGVGFLLCLASVSIIKVLDNYQGFSYASILYIGIWLVPLQALVLLHEDMARSANNLTIAYGPSRILWPILIIIGGILFAEQNHSLNSIPMTEIAIATLLGVVVLQISLIWNKFDGEIASYKAIHERWEWLKVALPLLLNQALREILTQTDTLMVGVFLGAAAVGTYDAATKTSLWVSFILRSVNLLAAPAFAALYTQKNLTDLQKLVSTVTWWIFWPSLGISILFMLFATPLLAIFGSEFVSGSLALRILVIGQFISSLCGSVGYLMAMTGYQNDTLIPSVCCALINLVSNAIAIPLLGLTGAAITTTFTYGIWNIWLGILVVQKIGIYPSIFSWFFNKSELPNELS